MKLLVFAHASRGVRVGDMGGSLVIDCSAALREAFLHRYTLEQHLWNLAETLHSVDAAR